MSQQPRILAFAGSSRPGSVNRKLVRIAANGAAAAGAQVTVLELGDYPLPLYTGEIGVEAPGSLRALRDLMSTHDGLLISSPEFNGSFTPLLKNTLDWLSTPLDGKSGLALFEKKVAAIMSASPGGFGGLRGLGHVREVLSYMGVLVLPEQFAVGNSREAFDEAGRLKNAKLHSSIERLGESVARAVGLLTGHGVAKS